MGWGFSDIISDVGNAVTGKNRDGSSGGNFLNNFVSGVGNVAADTISGTGQAITRGSGEIVKGAGSLLGNGAIGQGLQHLGGQASDKFWGTWGAEADGQTAAAPTTTQPTIADGNTIAVNQTLQNEKQNFWQRTNLTGGMGLLDNPKTASQTLLGN